MVSAPRLAERDWSDRALHALCLPHALWFRCAQVGWLLAAGAMLEAHNKYQWTPYDLAVRRGNDEVAELLLEEQRHRMLLGQ